MKVDILKSSLKILVFAHDSSLYGASRSLLTLLEQFISKHNIEVLVIFPYKGKMIKLLQKKNIPYKVISFPRCVSKVTPRNYFNKIKERIKYSKNEKAILPQLIDIATRFSPDIIYTNTSVVSIGYKISKTLNIPHVWHIREFGNFYNFNYLPSRKEISKKIALNTHNIFVSEALKNHWMNKKKGKSSVIYNGITSSDSYFVPRSFPTNRKFVIGIIGAITPGKGQDIAIKALLSLKVKYPFLKLAIYGNIIDKTYFNQLTKLIEQKEDTNTIEFCPFESNQEKLYDSINLLLNCSVMEGFGRTIVEAMERGIPVIANASGGPLEIIRHKENGLLFQQTAKSLSEMITLILENKYLYEDISKNGLKNAKEVYSKTKYVESVVKIFKSIIQNDKTN